VFDFGRWLPAAVTSFREEARLSAMSERCRAVRQPDKRVGLERQFNHPQERAARQIKVVDSADGNAVLSGVFRTLDSRVVG
jgi:hypothetical protein